MGTAQRVGSAVAAQVGAGLGTQGARVNSPAVAFSTVMQTQGTDGQRGGMDLDRAMDLYAQSRTLECQEMLAAQKSGDVKRAGHELRERVEAALDGGGHVVRPRRLRLARPHAALPAAADAG